ncbi:sporulation protein YpjB [Ornithinibacillus halophilus]|uniref:Sporulation protein YpjB (SpoYpjB) n=1 Tax=Ornithinibacillus halophilus TaxID=930117 RepID=A0A1M5CNV5_9BACI|nr:sporulation protein YpjB [Ornithinibacillus halophilus]SHF56444.1 Sporulation protein YpjB (SpoYpjB) [Ornithinibacillus halophilus]
MSKCKIQVLIPIAGIMIYLMLNSVFVESVQAESIKTDDEPSMVPFFWGAGMVGGIIAITLTYVSWRKYKGEKKRGKKEKTDRHFS